MKETAGGRFTVAGLSSEAKIYTNACKLSSEFTIPCKTGSCFFEVGVLSIAFAFKLSGKLQHVN